MELSGENNQSLPAIVLWGCFGGICLAGVYFFLQGMWARYQLTDSRFSLYHDIHIIIVFTFLFAVLGFLAGELFSTGKNSREYRTGIISGTCTTLMFISILAFQKFVSESAGFSDWIIPLAGMFVSSVAIQAICAYSCKPRYGSEQDDPDSLHKPAIAGKLRKYWYFIPTILAIVIIPPGLLFFAIWLAIILLVRRIQFLIYEYNALLDNYSILHHVWLLFLTHHQNLLYRQQ